MANRINLLIVLAVLLTAGLLSFHQIDCDDHWWHIATGHLMREKMELPPTDVFSFTYEGAPWRNNEWGFGLIISLVWDHLGEIGFFLYRWLILSGIAFFLLFAVDARRRRYENGPPDLSFMFSLLAFILLLLQIRIAVRPHLLGYLFLSVLVWRLQRPVFPAERSWRTFVAALLFFVAWAFVHYSWTIGLLLSVLVVGDHYILSRWGTLEGTLIALREMLTRHKRYFLPGLLVAGMIAFLFFNSGPIVFILSHLVGLDDTYEWKPYSYWLQMHPFFAVTIAYYLIFVLSLPGILRISPLYALLTVITLLLSLKSLRFMSEFVIISMPWTIVRAQRFLSERGYVLRRGPRSLLVVVLWLAVAGSTLSFDRPWGIEVSTSKNPVSIADFIEHNGLAGNLYATNSSFHAYFMYRSWPHIKIFFDGRHKQVYPLSFIQAFSHTPFSEVIARYPMIDYVVKDIAISGLSRRPEDFLEARPSGYELAFFDQNWALFVKAGTFERYPAIKPLRMLYPINIASERLMRRVVEAGHLPILKEELAYYASQILTSEERQLYELMKAEIAKYGPVD